MAKKKKEKPAGTPDWMVTYGDMMTLLLCFFVILVSMSEIKKDKKFQQVLESIRMAFGYDATLGQVPIQQDTRNSMIQQLQHITVPIKSRHRGDSSEKSIRAEQIRVTDVREGIRIEIGGKIAFKRFSAALTPEADDALAQMAKIIAGHNSVIKLTGHATNEPLPLDSLYSDAWALSYARARAVGDALERHGVRSERLRLEAAGCQAPLQAQAYTEKTRALNRRVEIVVTEALIDEYAGQTYDGEERG